ncbi:MAG: hypothetical protein F6K10_12615 [Moorea sp. SIO2B7]|nr:hypothetical protein [Moorena sp. SIO2B7]
MTRQPHDQFAKDYLEELLTPLGKVDISKNVTSEVREIDVWFSREASSPLYLETLGLLGQMAISASSCLFEPYRNPVTQAQIRSCLLKLYALEGDLYRQAKREQKALKEGELPFLGILTPTCSVRILESFAATPDESNWGGGIYFFPKSQRAALVVIHQLPVTTETLWLRVLGKGSTQQQALSELITLPGNNPVRHNLLEILANWRKNLEVRDNLTSEDREVIMRLSPAYLQQKEEWRLEGRQEVQQEIVESSLRARFGELDSDLQGIIPLMLNLPTSELTSVLINLSNLTREELLERFS